MTPQTFTIQLAGTDYTLTATWNVPSSVWLVSIANANGQALVSSIPLVTGCDLLEQFEYVGIGGQLFSQTDHDPFAPPTFENLGTLGRLFFVLPPPAA